MLHLFDPFLKTAIYDEPASRLICLCEVFDGLIFLTRNTAIGGVILSITGGSQYLGIHGTAWAMDRV